MRQRRVQVKLPPFRKVYMVALRIPYYVFSGPVGDECVYELHGLFKLLTGCYL
jgi:hypothetical protein